MANSSLNPWLRHPRVWYGVIAFMMLATLVMLVKYRDPPTEVGNQLGPVPFVQAGKEVIIDMQAVRHMGQRCSVETSRSIIDVNRSSDTFIPYQFLTAEGRELRELKSPGRIHLTVVVPSRIPSGPALIATENRYKCLYNPTTWFLPIEDSWVANITVLPKE